ncbi:hypothetical protein BDV95DRAFT_325062 [Massariosphaeria phaeospora]|uniref:Uncharacterized protein n=1 Tax=Massariosphaeria phaeospora TaxID=100035 RepID=A0A7C8MBA4_9PLEO|nr:hypothetical protein BDV95DRAFT_325062 [Massariosphaeria phaeospora]
MLFNTLATLALATVAAATPIAKRAPAPVTPRQSGGGFNFLDNFNNINNQQNVVQIQEQSLQVIDDGRQQLVIQQASEVLIVQGQKEGFKNSMNDVFRKSKFRNDFKDVTTVILVVQEIQIVIDDGRGDIFQAEIFAQSVIVANRGSDATQTVMIFSQETLIAQQILGEGREGEGFGGDIEGEQKPSKNNDVQLFGAKPTWDSVMDDPAASLGAAWEAELQDVQNLDNAGADNEANKQAAEQEKKVIGEAIAAQDAQNQDAENQAQAQADEAQKAAEEQAKAAEEQAKAGEEAAKAAEEQAQAQMAPVRN